MTTSEIREVAKKVMAGTTQKDPSWWQASHACSMCATADHQRSAGLSAQATESERQAQEALAAARCFAGAL